MRSKYRILTYHHITNNGAFLFAYALMKLFQEAFPSADVRVLDYKSPRLGLIEYLKRFKFFQGIPLFYLKRSRIWDRTLPIHLDLDADFPKSANEKVLQQFFSEQYDAVIVGMDVWCLSRGIERPPFPNLYWLPETSNIPKIAYGVSGYKSEPELINRNASKIKDYLDEFAVIGCRDRFTHEMVLSHRTSSGGLIERIPDPTLFFDFPSTSIMSKLTALGVDLSRPLLGVLLFGQKELSQTIHAHFRAKGYQVLALSMYNPWVDINLGHLLDPFEWAETFRLLSFCITDRFHGTAFCIKHRVPFFCLEKERELPSNQSKLYDLVSEFDLPVCYANPQEGQFTVSDFIGRIDEVELAWEDFLKPRIEPKLHANLERQKGFIQAMKAEIAGWKA